MPHIQMHVTAFYSSHSQAESAFTLNMADRGLIDRPSVAHALTILQCKTEFFFLVQRHNIASISKQPPQE